MGSFPPFRSLYDELGLDPSATTETIHRRYRAVYHQYKDDPSRHAAVETAYRILSDPVSRARYDSVDLPEARRRWEAAAQEFEAARQAAVHREAEARARAEREEAERRAQEARLAAERAAAAVKEQRTSARSGLIFLALLVVAVIWFLKSGCIEQLTEDSSSPPAVEMHSTVPDPGTTTPTTDTMPYVPTPAPLEHEKILVFTSIDTDGESELPDTTGFIPVASALTGSLEGNEGIQAVYWTTPMNTEEFSFDVLNSRAIENECKYYIRAHLVRHGRSGYLQRTLIIDDPRAKQTLFREDDSLYVDRYSDVTTQIPWLEQAAARIVQKVRSAERAK